MKTEDRFFEPLKETKMSIPIRVTELEKKQIEEFLKECAASGLRLKLKPVVKKHIDEARAYLKKHPELKPGGGSEKSADPQPKDTSAPVSSGSEKSAVVSKDAAPVSAGSEKSADPKPKDTSASGPEKTEDDSGSGSEKKKSNSALTRPKKPGADEKKPFWSR